VTATPSSGAGTALVPGAWGSFLECLEAELAALEAADDPLAAYDVVAGVELPTGAGPLPEAHRERAELLLRRLAGAQSRVVEAMERTTVELASVRHLAALPTLRRAEVSQFVDARA
jgi:hypothetical protein